MSHRASVPVALAAGVALLVATSAGARSASAAEPGETDWLAPDKAAHAAVSYSLTLTGTLLLEKAALGRWPSLALAAAATLVIGLGKEVVLDDVVSGGDLLADSLGAAAAAVVIISFDF